MPFVVNAIWKIDVSISMMVSEVQIESRRTEFAFTEFLSETTLRSAREWERRL